jgi:hypothetical protein
MEREEPRRLGAESRLAVAAAAILVIVLDARELVYEPVLVLVLQAVIVLSGMILASARKLGPLHDLMVMFVMWAGVATLIVYD